MARGARRPAGTIQRMVNPQLRVPRSRGRLVGMQEQLKLLCGPERISRTRFFAFSTFFGRGVAGGKGKSVKPAWILGLTHILTH